MRHLGDALGHNEERPESSEEEETPVFVIASPPSSLNDLGPRLSATERLRRTQERSMEHMEKMMKIEQLEMNQFSKKVIRE